MKMGKKQFSALSFILSTAIFWEMLAVTSVLADNAYPSWEQPIGNLTEKSGAQAVCSVRLSRIFINKLCESDDEGGFGSAYSAESMDDTGSPVEKDCYTGSAKMCIRDRI